MEQLQEEVPEVKEEEEEEAVMVASGASDPSGGPDSSLPSSSYTGEWSHGSSSVSAASMHPCPLGSVLSCMGRGPACEWSLACFNLFPLGNNASRAKLWRGLFLLLRSLAQPLAAGWEMEIKRTGR